MDQYSQVQTITTGLYESQALDKPEVDAAVEEATNRKAVARIHLSAQKQGFMFDDGSVALDTYSHIPNLRKGVPK